MNRLLLFALLVCLALLAWWSLRRRATTSTLVQEETAFGVADTAAVDRLFVAGKDGRTALLERQPDHTWQLNGRYRAAPAKVELLLRTLHHMEVKRPLGPAERENMIREMAVQHLKVEVYQRGNRVRVFFLGNETNDERGNYALIDGAEQPYVVHVRGFNGYLTPRFTITEAEWRDKEVFRAPVEALREVEVNYPGAPGAGFTLRRQAGHLTLADAPDAHPDRLAAYAALLARGLYVENYIADQDAPAGYRDSLLLQPPDARLRLVSSASPRPVVMQLYYLPGNQDRVAGLLGEARELVTVQRQLLEKILQRRSFFMPPPAG